MFCNSCLHLRIYGVEGSTFSPLGIDNTVRSPHSQINPALVLAGLCLVLVFCDTSGRRLPPSPRMLQHNSGLDAPVIMIALRLEDVGIMLLVLVGFAGVLNVLSGVTL